jgi:hypothetical protein
MVCAQYSRKTGKLQPECRSDGYIAGDGPVFTNQVAGGQIVGMLRQLGVKPPATDIVFYYYEQAAAAAS